MHVDNLHVTGWRIITRFWETAHLPFPGPKPTLTLTSHLKQNVGLG